MFSNYVKSIVTSSATANFQLGSNLSIVSKLNMFEFVQSVVIVVVVISVVCYSCYFN